MEEVVVGRAIPAWLDVVHASLDRFRTAIDASGSPLPGPSVWTEFAIGLVEIATNVIQYAYPSSGPAGEFEVRLRLYADRLEALLTDHGQPFVESRLDAPGDLAEGGYGLPLTRRALDRVEYRRDSSGRNHWHLAKFL